MRLAQVRERIYRCSLDLRHLPGNLRAGRAIVRSGSRPVPYLGAGIRNLGDVALRQAIGATLGGAGLLCFNSRSLHRVHFAEWLGADFRVFCLGGGTLINSPGYLEWSRSLARLGLRGVAFGTGVCDPDFRGRAPGRDAGLAAWAEHLRSYDRVTVRGPRSAEILHAAGVSNVTVAGDPALYYWRPDAAASAGSRTLIINVGRSFGQCWGSGEDRILAEMRRAALELLRQGFDLIVVSVRNTDHDLAAAFASSLGAPRRVRFEAVEGSVERYLRIVTGAEAALALKLHAAVLAACRCVPPVMIEYQPKCLDFMRSVELERYNVRADAAAASAIVRLVNEAIERRKEIAGAISRWAATYQARLAGVAKTIRELHA